MATNLDSYRSRLTCFPSLRITILCCLELRILKTIVSVFDFVCFRVLVVPGKRINSVPVNSSKLKFVDTWCRAEVGKLWDWIPKFQPQKVKLGRINPSILAVG